jgi:hypothetical protein
MALFWVVLTVGAAIAGIIDRLFIARESRSGGKSCRMLSVGMRHTTRRQTTSSGGNVDISTSGTPALAIEQGTATEKERSEWVRQAQIPIIYQEDDDKGKKKFMVIYRTSAGAAAIESLGGAADLGDAAAKARSFLNEHPGDAGLGNYGQEWKNLQRS